MEKEIMDISEALSAGNLGGVSAPLVDAEGFPRADVDVHATRTLRNRLACLNTDHKALMVRIEQGLMGALPPVDAIPTGQPQRRVDISEPAVTGGTTGATPPGLATSTGPCPMDVVDEMASARMSAFAEIDEVADSGPAAAAGVLVGDLLLQFGSVDASNHDGLRALARLTQRMVGETIPILVRRAGSTHLALRLQPRRWSGNGLLGCHLKPL